MKTFLMHPDRDCDAPPPSPGVTVFFVSHMYEFARAFLDDNRVLFLSCAPTAAIIEREASA